jgi:hypothetical protein
MSSIHILRILILYEKEQELVVYAKQRHWQQQRRGSWCSQK